jgi:thiamine-monophosphate kinase
LDEFAIIQRLFAPLAAGHQGALGLTDDAALIDGPGGTQWVVTADALVAGVHFLPDDPADLIARKLVRVNISDLAAKGATPMAVLLAVCFPSDVTEEWLERFAAGLKADCETFGVGLIGGDTVATPGPLTLAMTALGQVATGSAILRSNARSGHDIWVSGTIGDAVLGLAVAKGDDPPGLDAAARSFLLGRYRLPEPRAGLGRALVGLAKAGMDISDGLIGDLAHMCRASDVGAVVEAGKVPLSGAARRCGSAIAALLTGGDDYELLFTAEPGDAASIAAKGGEFGVGVTRIGRITDEKGVKVVDESGKPVALGPLGYRHFAGTGR